MELSPSYFLPAPFSAKSPPSERLSHLAPVVQTLDSAIHRINHYPADSVIGFPNTYPLDSDLSVGKRYPTFEQLGPVCFLCGFIPVAQHRRQEKVFLSGRSPEIEIFYKVKKIHPGSHQYRQ